MLDIHSHIVPCVDDGSCSMAETQGMLLKAKSVGISSIVCTVHCRWDDFDKNTVEHNYAGVAALAQDVGIETRLGYEVNWQKFVEIGEEEGKTLNIQGTDLFLLEFSDNALPTQWRNIIRSIQNMGYRVIIAHPERYIPIQKDIEIAYKMHDMGCLLQLSTNFYSSGRASKHFRTAIRLLHNELVDYVASDAHNSGDYIVYQKAMKYIRRR